MYPELIHQMVLERAERFQRAADQYRRGREGRVTPPRPVRKAIERRLSAGREELGRLAFHREAPGGSTK